jgi:hypothetical protein
MILTDANGVQQSVTCCSGWVVSGALFAPFSLDHTGDLSAIVSISFRVDLLQSSTGNIPVLSSAVNGPQGPIPSTGVGFIMTVQGGLACTDLWTSVIGLSAGILTLATPLSTQVPPLPADGSAGNSLSVGLCRDESALFQSFLAQVPDYARISIPPGCRIPVGRTLSFTGRQGIKIEGEGAIGGAASLNNKAQGFVWVGACAGMLLSLNRSRDCIFNDLFFSAGPFHEPASLVEIDMTGGGSLITTYHRFRGCSFTGPSCWSKHNCVVIARTAQANCEFMRFQDCWFQPSIVSNKGGCGVWIGSNPNAKSELFYNCKFNNGTVGIYLSNGSFVSIDCSGDFQYWSYYVAGATEPIRIVGHNAEFCQRAGYFNCVYPVRIDSCRWSSTILPLNVAPFLTGPGTNELDLENNKLSACVTPCASRLVDYQAILRYHGKSNKWDSWSRTAVEGLESQYGWYISSHEHFLDGITKTIEREFFYFN